MKSPLHILHLEDDPSDSALVQSTLKDGGISCTTTRVQTERDFVAALERGGIDLILSDYTMPAFDGLSALKIARATQPSLPVIFVSGTLGEERAVESLTSGATDYVLKGGLSRLAPAVRRAMHDLEERGERQRLEAQLIEGQKMDVIGQLAGGVAHDFNNILAVIMGYCHLLKLDNITACDQLKYVDEIQLASERAAGLTRQLLAFSRRQTVQPVLLDLNKVVKDMDQMLRQLIDANIEMTVVYGEGIGRIHADSGYVGQVLMNLVVNARDAMPYGGKLVIETADVTIDENYPNAPLGSFPNDYVVLLVSDTGTGMTDEVKARLFEPLFTTKPPGKGTGLGLTTCKNIIQQSGGFIDVFSESGQGTTFQVYFPRQTGSVAAEIQSTASDVLPRGTETLLVVDDEPALRHLACTVLKAQGYQVLEASNGVDGVRLAANYQGPPVRLVIADVIMPLMGGMAMAELLKITDPEINILFTSGYPDEALLRYGVLDPSFGFLGKPYSPATLARKVRQMLDQSPRSSGESTKDAPMESK